MHKFVDLNEGVQQTNIRFHWYLYDFFDGHPLIFVWFNRASFTLVNEDLLYIYFNNAPETKIMSL